MGVLRESRRRGRLVRITAGATPDEWLRGLAVGRFPFPRSNGSRFVPWYVPRERALLRAENVHLGRTLQRRLRREGWITSVDEAFEEVVGHCADRQTSWITPAAQEIYAELHRRGHAYSLEVWSPDGRLVAGTFGAHLGGLFSADSMFHTEDHASKVALVDAASRVRSAGGLGLDCQYPKPHTSALGAEIVGRAAFRRLLADARTVTACLPTGRLPAARLIDPSSPDALDLE